MIITRQQIKQVLKELLNARIEMTLVDYSSSNEESITKTRVVNLNLMSLKFMLNESFTSDEKNSILIAKDVMNFFLDMSNQFENSITMNVLSKKKSFIMNITFNLNQHSKKENTSNILSHVVNYMKNE